MNLLYEPLPGHGPARFVSPQYIVKTGQAELKYWLTEDSPAVVLNLMDMRKVVLRTPGGNTTLWSQ